MAAQDDAQVLNRLTDLEASIKALEETAKQAFVSLGQPAPQFGIENQRREPKQKPEQQQQQQQGSKPKAPKPQATASKQAFQFDLNVAEANYKHDKYLPPVMICCDVTNYKNTMTNTSDDVQNSYTENEKSMRELVQKLPLLKSSIFYRAPPQYYEMTLGWRRDLLGAPSIHYLCKSMLMRNSKCPHEEYSNKMDSKYYFCVIQYSARLHNDKIGHAIRRLYPEVSRPPSKNFNFRWTEPEVSVELSGQPFNGVTPLGSKHKVPVILSHKIAQLPESFLWLGGGEVDLKWRISVADFVKYFDPIIDDITYDEPSHEDKDPE